jgi:hypothetical protein
MTAPKSGVLRSLLRRPIGLIYWTHPHLSGIHARLRNRYVPALSTITMSGGRLLPADHVLLMLLRWSLRGL